MSKVYRLKSMRNYRGLTLEVAAKKLGISKQALNQKELNETGITVSSFLKIAESYDFTVIGFPNEQLNNEFIKEN